MFITNIGREGGSNVTAAIVNTLEMQAGRSVTTARLNVRRKTGNEVRLEGFKFIIHPSCFILCIYPVDIRVEKVY